jgi:hypothetical protein
MDQTKLEVKTGSQEELDMLERIETLRIASAERKWKIELRDKRVQERRSEILDHLQRNDGAAFAVYSSLCAIVVIGCICAIKITWHFCS